MELIGHKNFKCCDVPARGFVCRVWSFCGCCTIKTKRILKKRKKLVILIEGIRLKSALALGSLLANSGEKTFTQFLFAILSYGFIGYSQEFILNMLMLHYIR